MVNILTSLALVCLSLFGIILSAAAVAVGIVLMTFAVHLIWAFPCMWAWNYVMPYLFGLPAIEYMHAYCLLVLATLLVKSSFNSGGSSEKKAES